MDHLEAHVESAFIENREIPFPALALLVSGGHTSTILLKKKLSFEQIARTRDDAAGEALDKIAKFLDLDYPGGPVIERLALKGNPKEFPFATPHMTDGSLDFSFSGLKTAALRHIREQNISKDFQYLDTLNLHPALTIVYYCYFLQHKATKIVPMKFNGDPTIYLNTRAFRVSA